jgi:hypothetical protein
MKRFVVLQVTALILAWPGQASAQPTIDEKLDKIITVLELSRQATDARFQSVDEKFAAIAARLAQLEQRSGSYTPYASPPAPTYTPPVYIPAPLPEEYYNPLKTYTPPPAPVYTPQPPVYLPEDYYNPSNLPPWPYGTLSPLEKQGMSNVVRQMQHGPPYRPLSASEAAALNNLFDRICNSK